MVWPDIKLPEVDLRIEHAGHKVELTGDDPEYRLRFPTLLSALHYGLTFWPLRKLAPGGLLFNLEWRTWRYRFRTPTKH